MGLEQKIKNELERSLKGLLSLEDLKINMVPGSISNEADPPDLVACARYGDLHFQLIIEVVAQTSLPLLKDKISRLKAIANASNHAVPVLAAPYLSRRRQNICRDQGVCFVDLSGNVFIKFRSLYVERIGFPNKFPEERKGRGPFSDKASLILRSILKDGGHLWGVRELAQRAHLDPGFVSRMAKELEKRKYISRIDSKIKLRDPVGILDDWARNYNFNKNKNFSYFLMATSSVDVLDKLRNLKIPSNVNYALSVQAGGNLVAPYAAYQEVHMYVGNEKALEYFRKQMNLENAEQGANLVLMLPYYKHSVFHDSRIIDSLRVVSDIQLYLDLHSYPIRGLEQAEHLLDKKLKPLFEKVNRNE
jgi:DNA-binding Lrp family transcriptional regulator